MVRDLAALNKVEMLPWDGWGALAGEGAVDADPLYVDEVAKVTTSVGFEAVRALYETDDRLRVPSIVTTYRRDGPHQVAVPELPG